LTSRTPRRRNTRVPSVKDQHAGLAACSVVGLPGFWTGGLPGCRPSGLPDCRAGGLLGWPPADMQ